MVVGMGRVYIYYKWLSKAQDAFERVLGLKAQNAKQWHTLPK